MSSCFMLPLEQPFQVDRQIQHHWSRDNPVIPVRIEEEEGYIENTETRWRTQRAKGKSMIFWRYLAHLGPRLAEEHTLPPHQQIGKQMPSRRSERSEGSGGGTKAQTSEKSLSQPSHPCMIRRSDDREPETVKLLPRPSWRDSPPTGNSKQAHKTTTIPPPSTTDNYKPVRTNYNKRR